MPTVQMAVALPARPHAVPDPCQHAWRPRRAGVSGRAEKSVPGPSPSSLLAFVPLPALLGSPWSGGRCCRPLTSLSLCALLRAQRLSNIPRYSQARVGFHLATTPPSLPPSLASPTSQDPDPSSSSRMSCTDPISFASGSLSPILFLHQDKNPEDI